MRQRQTFEEATTHGKTLQFIPRSSFVIKKEEREREKKEKRGGKKPDSLGTS